MGLEDGMVKDLRLAQEPIGFNSEHSAEYGVKIQRGLDMKVNKRCVKQRVMVEKLVVGVLK